MKLDKVYRKIHRKIEDLEDKKISQREMAERIGCSIDTYGGHIRGTNEPAAVQHFIKLLSMLDENDAADFFKFIKEELND